MKQLLKQSVRGVAILMVIPVLVLYFLVTGVLARQHVIAGFSQGMALLPGIFGVYLRAAFYRFTLTYCAPDAVIGFLTLLSQQDIEIGAGSYIGPQCNLGSCRIGKDTLLGSGVHILSGKGQHNFSDLDTPIKHQGGTFVKVSVGDNCWVGNSALIMADIGSGSVVAAGAVVIEPVPENAIVAGNPARVIKMRGE